MSRSLPSRWLDYGAVAGQVLSASMVVVYLLLLEPRLFPAEGVAAMDFQCFWAASNIALTAAPREVYEPEAMRAAQVALHGARGDAATGCMFIYLPNSLLLFLPLALLPYTVSAVVWLAATFAAYALTLRTLLPGWAAVLPFLAFPAAFLNAWYVQNGFFSAALLGLAVRLMERWPVLAGLCIGCLAYKPQLGVAVPLALAATGRWRVFAAAAATVLGFAAAATVVFGADIWPAFLTSTGEANGWIEHPPHRVALDMASVFSAVRLMGGQIALAHATQGAVAVGACALMVTALRRKPGARAEGALMVAAVPLATPYLFHYDQVILAIPLAWVLAEALRTGFLPWERAILVTLLVSPALAEAEILAWGAPLAPLISVGVFAAALRRVRHLSASEAAPAAPSPGVFSREAWAQR